ncbi:putative lipoprotein YfhM [BD1-7 clade bacterium]|uniref:Putative lipoprotein YfhM n=1 Tax=BD1-7 clade bacterium TaxID=2029982 RepID=A0A5S9QY27_9GAMM|nr:putative lipoprotein YfhM [BD1-7 clade bacterium]
MLNMEPLLKTTKTSGHPIRILTVLAMLSMVVACSDQAGNSNSRVDNAHSPSDEQAATPAQNTPSSVIISPATEAPTLTAWDQVIDKPPARWVSAVGPVNIGFSQNLRGENALNQPIDGALSIMPKVPADVYFSADNQLQIQFHQPLQPATQYTLQLEPASLAGVDPSLTPMAFTIEPYRQDFSVQTAGVTIDNSGQAEINGTLELNDAVAEETIRKVLNARIDKQPVTINFEQTSPLKWAFTIKGIQQGRKETNVLLSWNGKELNVDKQGATTILIPAKMAFDVLSIVARQEGKQEIVVRFSQPLANQSLNGLVSINGKEPQRTRINGNELKVYPTKALSGDVTLTLESGIKAANNKRLSDNVEKTLTFLTHLPGVKFADNTYILPSGSNRIPIKAVNVDSVQITAYKLPRNNLGDFLRYNSIDRSYLDNNSTVTLWRKTYSLPEPANDQWKTFQLELMDLAKDGNNDVIALQLSIDAGNTTLTCNSDAAPISDALPTPDWQTDNDNQPSWVSKYYESQGYYNWRDRRDPCKNAYYQANNDGLAKSVRYFLPSDLGIIAKMAADHSMRITITNLKTSDPIDKASVVLYDNQNQQIGETQTNAEGFANITPAQPPAYMIVESGKTLGFLRVNRNDALSTNNFDVGGKAVSGTIKGFFYAERGVWRPGDAIHLNFIVEDKSGRFDPSHPLTVDFFDPKGTKVAQQTQARPVGGIYAFTLKTAESAPTGNWRAVIRYGGNYFSKVIPVETIVPNRLKMALEFSETPIIASKQPTDVSLSASWLNGATAKNLKADIKLVANATKTRFTGFSQYLFDDPARTLKTRPQEIFNGKLDAKGDATAQLPNLSNNAPGALALTFTTRVFENSGAFSTQYQTVNYLPYDNWVGINVPNGSGWGGAIGRDDTLEVDFVTLTPSGEPTSGQNLDLTVYKLGWSWWWDSADNDLSRYISGRHSQVMANKKLTTNNDGHANWQLRGADFGWGRYLIRVCDNTSGHCSGKIAYIGWSSNAANENGAEFLTLTTEKSTWVAGETARIKVPEIAPAATSPTAAPNDTSTTQYRWLLTLETASRVIDQRWVTPDSTNHIDVALTADMAPNVYAHLTLIQALDNKQNDRPVRMYGIVPLLVEDPLALLQPEITAPESVRPNQTLRVQIGEKSHRRMAYTLAVVDEGLLSITNYQTPDPHGTFFSREKLGVLTWDLYQWVSSAVQGRFYPAIQIGGSDSGEDDEAQSHRRRFPPVVRFIGPFELETGATASHEIDIPNYMGAVRIMVVAAHDNLKIGGEVQQAAYGSASQSVTVSQPLTLLTTLPRVLGPQESLDVPVTVFANDEKVRRVDVTSETNNLLKPVTANAEITFNEPGDKIAELRYHVADHVGQARFDVKATAGNGAGQETASDTVFIDVRSANQPQTQVQSQWLEAKQTTALQLTPIGIAGTNISQIGFSQLPNIDLTEQLTYLIGYPHGCIEQTTSKAFPQLYLGRLTPLSDVQKSEISENVRAAIEKLHRFQNTDGSFDYWPWGNSYNPWANTYAGHFLIEARKMGFVVPQAMLASWLSNQRDIASGAGSRAYYFATDAYTLYALALAGEPDFAAMNRLKAKMEQSANKTPGYAQALLGAAYATAGVKDTAKALIKQAQSPRRFTEKAAYTYGSSLRNQAITVIAQQAAGDHTAALTSAQKMAEAMQPERWYSTQSRAFALIALGEIAEDLGKANAPVSYRINDGQWQTTALSGAFARIGISQPGQLNVEFRNDGTTPVFVSLTNQGVPANGNEKAISDNLKLEVTFADSNGNPIDVSRLQQGTDIVATVTVTATNNTLEYNDLALITVMPSGWQISDSRLDQSKMPDGVTYQDIRDDRVLSYFSLLNSRSDRRIIRRSITLSFNINASFKGRFYLPTWQVGAMYDDNIKAATKGQWVEVIDETVVDRPTPKQSPTSANTQ